MDEFVGALVEVYRALAGPGMSTYMQAYQGGPSGQMNAQGSQPYVIPGAPMTGVHPAATPGSMPMPGMQGMAHPTPSPYNAFADQSQVALPVKKSKTGLIIAIVALLLIAGGVVIAVVVAGGNKDSGSGSGSQTASGSGSASASGSGSASASGSGHGSASGSATASGSGRGSASSGSGSATASGSGSASSGSGSATASGSSGSGSATASGSGSATASGSDAGSGTASGTGSGQGSAEPTVITVAINSATPGAHVFDGKKDLGAAPLQVRVIPGEPLTLTVKARGFKDMTQTVDGQTDNVSFDLVKQAIIRHPPGNGSGSGSGSGGGGMHQIQEDAIKKYCKEHPDDLRCQAG
jgi:hypothetical protein